jgi:hypothetical protein
MENLIDRPKGSFAPIFKKKKRLQRDGRLQVKLCHEGRPVQHWDCCLRAGNTFSKGAKGGRQRGRVCRRIEASTEFLPFSQSQLSSGNQFLTC